MTLLAWLSPAFAATVAVPQDHATITEAIAASARGDTITIEPGVYVEHVVIDKELELAGTAPGVVLQADGQSDEVVWVQADARIGGVDIDGAGVARGVATERGAELHLDSVQVHDGWAPVGSWTWGDGAGVLALGPLTLVDVEVRDSVGEACTQPYGICDWTRSRSGMVIAEDGLVMRGSTVQDASESLVTVWAGDAWIEDSEFIGSQDGLYLNGATSYVMDSVFVGQGRNAVYTAGHTEIVGSVFLDNEVAVRARDTVDVRGCLFLDNLNGVSNTEDYPSSLACGEEAVVTLVQNTFLNNGGMTGWYSAAVTAASSADLHLQNNVFAGNTAALLGLEPYVYCTTGYYQSPAPPPTVSSDYNLFFANQANLIWGAWDFLSGPQVPSNFHHLPGPPAGASDQFGVNPLYTAFSDDGDWTNDDLTPAPGSPLIDNGNPAYSDPDGTVSDIGHHSVP